MPKAIWLVFLVLPALGGAVPGGGDEPGEEAEKILRALQAKGLQEQLQGAALLARAEDPVWDQVVGVLTGSGSAANRRVRELIERLDDPSWRVREAALSELVELGATAVTALERARQGSPSPEVRWRAERALELIGRAGPQVAEIWRRQIGRLRAVARGLAVAPPQRAKRREKAGRLLFFAMEDQDPLLSKHALLALSHLGLESAIAGLGKLARTGETLEVMAALHGLGQIDHAAAREWLARLMKSHESAMVRLAAGVQYKRAGLSPGELSGLPALTAHLAAYRPLSPGAAEEKEPPPWNILPLGGRPFPARIRQIHYGGMVVQPEGAPPLQVPLGQLVSASPPRELPPDLPEQQGWVLLRSGSWLPGKVIALDPEEARVELALLGRRRIARADLRAFGFGPRPPAECTMKMPRDRLCLPDGVRKECSALQVRAGLIEGEGLDRKVPMDRGPYYGILAGSFGRGGLHQSDPGHTALVHSFDLFPGGTVKGFFLEGTGRQVLLAEPVLGLVALPLDRVRKIRFRTGLGLGFNFVLAADFERDLIFQIGLGARVTWKLDGLDSPWDVELLPSGNLLVCQQDGRIRELTREGREVWSLGGFNTPYDADKLFNGNYLIADTGNRRIVEVDRHGKVVWQYGQVEAFDVERLPSGNTLISDWKGKRVIEVDRAGAITWAVNNLKDPYDADRLDNGNTLITIWGDDSKVVEVNPAGKVVWQVLGLDAPMDADRLVGGRTLVTCANGVKLLDYAGKLIWEVKAEWAVEANWY